jgi:hypothetical protein
MRELPSLLTAKTFLRAQLPGRITPVKVQPGVQIEIDADFASGRCYLPIVRVKRAA